MFIARSWEAVWSGKRPRTLKRLLRYGRLGFNMQTALPLTFVTVGEIAPGTLRAMLKVSASVRNQITKPKLGRQASTEWRLFYLKKTINDKKQRNLYRGFRKIIEKSGRNELPSV